MLAFSFACVNRWTANSLKAIYHSRETPWNVWNAMRRREYLKLNCVGIFRKMKQYRVFTNKTKRDDKSTAPESNFFQQEIKSTSSAVLPKRPDYVVKLLLVKTRIIFKLLNGVSHLQSAKVRYLFDNQHFSIIKFGANISLNAAPRSWLTFPFSCF